MGLITFQIPQAGQANTTEDPKVASALQALLTLQDGGIDPINTNGFVDWTPLTSFGTGMQVAPGTYPLAARVVFGHVQLCGGLQATAAGPVAGATLCTLPAAFHPAQTVQFQNGFGVWQVDTTGVLTNTSAKMADNPGSVSLEGTQYRLA